MSLPIVRPRDRERLLASAHNWASHGADAWCYLSLAGRAPMRPAEPPPPPVMVPMNQITMDQFMDLEDDWSVREERV
jgi:hypothetical protein